MKFDLSKFLALVESHPVVFAKLIGTLLADALVLPKLVDALKNGTWAAFAVANQDLVVSLIAQVSDDLKADPTLLPAILTAAGAV